MKIVEKIKAKQKSLSGSPAVTIAFIGDSVTQGCYECYKTSEKSIETVFDYKSAYSTRVKEILNLLYPRVQFNIINAGISGDCATAGYKRLKRDVLAYHPDLCVVSYGLNDACVSTLEDYTKALEHIFTDLRKEGAETVFLTQNAMCTETSCHLTDAVMRDLSVKFSTLQNDGSLKRFMERAVAVSAKCGVAVCDLYPVWERLMACGVDITELLANKLNHPIREMHYYIAMKLVETILSL